MMAAEVLCDAGFAVEQCACAEDALALIATGYRPDILVTDQAMPGMSGTALANRLIADIGLKRVLIMSGGNEAELTPFSKLGKPYRSDELVSRIEELFASVSR